MKKLVCFLITAVMLTAALSIGANAALYSDYASAADGDLLYVADFRGEDVFAPKPNILATDGVVYTPEDEGRALHVKGVEGHAKDLFAYGAEIKGLTADKTTKYTFVYDIKMNGEVGKDNSVGVGGLGWHYTSGTENWNFAGNPNYGWRFLSNYGNYNSVFPAGSDAPNRTSLSVTNQKFADYVNGVEEAESDLDGYITCRLDFDGPANVFRAYALTKNGWKLLEEQTMKEIAANAVDAYGDTQYVGFWLYTYYDVVDFTLRDVRWYKGVNLSEEQLNVLGPSAAEEAEQAQPEAAAPSKAPTSARTADAVSVAVLAAVASLGTAVIAKKRKA